LGINQIRLTGPCSAPHYYGLGSIVIALMVIH
jgi:hypothetical protein